MTRAVTLKQPWASLVAVGAKTLLDQAKPTDWRGPLLVHAGKRPCGILPFAVADALNLGSIAAPGVPLGGGRVRFHGPDLPLGAVVASCVVAGCVPIGHLPAEFVFGSERYPTITNQDYEADFEGNIWRNGHMLKPRLGNRQYLTIQLGRGATAVTVHKLVAEAWLGPRPPGMEVRHFDGNNLNNAPWNLRYGTKIENRADAAYHGTSTGAANPNTKLTPTAVENIRSGRAAGVGVRELARLHGVAHKTIQKVLAGETHGERAQPDDSEARSRYAWLLEDVKATTERCPRCWGRGYDEGTFHPPLAAGCPVCKAYKTCAPVPMRGHQGIWVPDWETR